MLQLCSVHVHDDAGDEHEHDGGAKPHGKAEEPSDEVPVTCHVSHHVTCHMSHVCHVSHVTSHTSHVTSHTSHVTRHTCHTAALHRRCKRFLRMLLFCHGGQQQPPCNSHPLQALARGKVSGAKRVPSKIVALKIIAIKTIAIKTIALKIIAIKKDNRFQRRGRGLLPYPKLMKRDNRLQCSGQTLVVGQHSWQREKHEV